MNNIIWGNSGSPNVQAQIGVYGGAGRKVQYSIVQGGYPGLGNMNADPMLAADSLSNESPAIGAGTLEYDFGDGVVLQCPAFDINGRERPSPTGSMPDIGAWESRLSAPGAVVIRVPQDQPTIQAAIDAAVEGDTVLVFPGTYFENINYNGKNICVKSSAGADSTIIDGSLPADSIYQSVVTFMNGEDTTAVLSGFTITHGSGYYHEAGSRLGGGIICALGSSPTIEHNIIKDNTASDATSHNGEGGGIEITSDGSNPIIRYNVIWRNTVGEGAPNWIAPGGGISIWGKCKPLIMNNTIVDNVAPDGGGVCINSGGHPILRNNIIVNNHEEGIKIYSDSNGDFFYNNVWNNIPNNYIRNVTKTGDMSVDPLFVDPDNGDFRLRTGSPCIDAGDPNSPRDPDGSIADMGARPYIANDVAVDNSELESIPDSYKLHQNYPNPFNPTTTISYDLPQPGNVKLFVYNALGKKVAELVKNNQVEGSHSVTFDAQHLSTGIYFYQLQINGDFSARKKMVYLKWRGDRTSICRTPFLGVRQMMTSSPWPANIL